MKSVKEIENILKYNKIIYYYKENPIFLFLCE